MTLHDILYYYEHKLLPASLYEYKSDFVAILLKQKEVLYKVLNNIFHEERVENPYTENDFKLDVLQANDSLLVIKITFPEPIDAPLCYCSYLFIDRALENLNYFCVEKAAGICGEQKYLCSWTADGAHANYGSCDLEENEIYLKCLSIYERS